MDYTVGQRFRLRQHVGYDPDLSRADPRHPENHLVDAVKPNPDGPGYVLDMGHVGMYPLFADQVGEVVGVVPAGVAGAGQLHEEVVVMAFEHRQFLEHGVHGPAHEETGQSRNVSFTAEQMDAWFQPEDAS